MELTAAAIVLAAGASRRMGRPKMLLPYGRGTVLGSVVAALDAAGASPIVVVVAAGDVDLLAWCERDGGVDRRPTFGAGGGQVTATSGNRRLLLATNPAPERGMLSSVRVGLAALGGADAVGRRGAPLLVTPGDLPALRSGTVAELCRRRHDAGASLAVPTFEGRRGHPLLLAAALAAEIERLDPERGLRHLLDLHASELLSVEVDDPGCVIDLDTPEDYQRHQRQQHDR
jgi:molybdenum cofactor cytidylyltransferase